jgi:SHS2 domain-containing protein
MTIEELTHTADVRIRVKAPSIAVLFTEAARGMMRVMYGGCDRGTVTEELALDADDLEELLHDFLSELLYLSDVREMVYCSFQVRIDRTHLVAILEGIPFDRERHQGTEIKGVSYYGLQIVKEGESYATDILFDV